MGFRAVPLGMSRLTVVLSCLLALGLGARPGAAEDWPPPPGPAQTDQASLERLQAGEILVDNTLMDASGGAARVRAWFHGPATAPWDLLGDCAANVRFVAGLRDCELLEVSERQAVTRQVVKKHWLTPRLEYRFETRREPHDWVMIRLLDGNLRALSGSWRFDPAPGGDAVLVSHEIHVRPAMPVPRWLVRRTLRRDIGDMVACLRAEAGASGSPRQTALDRRRCP